jgi:hypothetical protein
MSYAPEHGCDFDLVFSRKEGIAELFSLTKGRLDDPTIRKIKSHRD